MTTRDGAHVLAVRVYHQDTDAGGVVHHASYLRFAERGRTEMLRDLGIAREPESPVFAVRRCEVDFLRPARLDDALEVRTRIDGASAASLWFGQTVCRDGEALAAMRVQVVRVRPDGRPARVPANLRRTAPAAAARRR